METGIGQYHATVLKDLNDRMEPRIVGIGGRPGPADDLA